MRVGVFLMMLLATAGLTAIAQPGAGPAPGGDRMAAGAWWRLERTAQELGLQAAQIEQLEKIYGEHRRAAIDLRADLEHKQLAMDELLRADAPDEAKVAAQLDAVSASRARLEKEQVLSILKARRQLTPEQWGKLKARQPQPGPPQWMGPGRGPRAPLAPRPPMAPQSPLEPVPAPGAPRAPRAPGSGLGRTPSPPGALPPPEALESLDLSELSPDF